MITVELIKLAEDSNHLNELLSKVGRNETVEYTELLDRSIARRSRTVGRTINLAKKVFAIIISTEIGIERFNKTNQQGKACELEIKTRQRIKDMCDKENYYIRRLISLATIFHALHSN